MTEDQQKITNFVEENYVDLLLLARGDENLVTDAVVAGLKLERLNKWNVFANKVWVIDNEAVVQYITKYRKGIEEIETREEKDQL